MIPILKKQLKKLHNTINFVDELNSGNGIADLVFFTDKTDLQRKFFGDYEVTDLIINKLCNKKEINFDKDELISHLSKNKKKLLKEVLLHNGIIKSLNNDEYQIIKNYSPPIKKLYAIEAKICDRISGFHQALRYKMFSHKTYLAISEDFLHRVDIELFKKYNIGLISVNSKTIDVCLKNKEEKPNNLTAQAHLSEQINQYFSA